jgi:hypothetical protein
MKPIFVGVTRLLVGCTFLGLVNSPSFADMTYGPLGVRTATAAQQAQQSMVAGPSIWRIGSSPGIRPLPFMSATPIVMPQPVSRTDYGVRPHFPITNTLIILPGNEPSYAYSGQMQYYPSIF